MSDDTGKNLKAKAAELVRHAGEHEGDKVPSAELGQLVAAVAEDLRTASADAAINEERLAKVETQTRVLSDAVMAINETISETPPDTLGPAVQAVKDEM